MFYVGKSLLHEALFGLSSESTSAHISTHSTTYSDGGRALRAAAGSRAAVTAIGGGRHTKRPSYGERPRPTGRDSSRPRPNHRLHVAALTARAGACRSTHRSPGLAMVRNARLVVPVPYASGNARRTVATTTENDNAGWQRRSAVRLADNVDSYRSYVTRVRPASSTQFY